MSEEKRNDRFLTDDDRDLSDLVRNIFKDENKDSESEKVYSFKE